MFTWEVVTDFDCDAPQESLQESFAKEFPEVQGSCVAFWKMVSFNAADGRKHRYLVAVTDVEQEGCKSRGHESRWHKSRGCEGCKSRGRTLPESIGLYALADREMRSCDCGGNMRFAAVVDGVLYILVFMEGRLCHWSEENGYGGDSAALVAERLERFDAFLAKDPLFSRADNRANARAEKGEDARVFDSRFYPEATFGMFAEAARDPFWKRLDLYGSHTAGLHVGAPVMLFALAAVATVGLVTVYPAQGEACEDCALAAAPELSAAPDEIPGDGLWTMGPAEPKLSQVRAVSGRGNTPPSACDLPALTIQGTVDAKLAQAKIAGEVRWLAVGDSVGTFAVVSIGSDRVQFVCNDKAVEVLNGSAPSGGAEHASR